MTNQNEASRIIDVIDSRVRKDTFSMARVETTWGTVAAVSSDGRYADLYLYGESSPYASEYFRLPNGLSVGVGDSVKAAIDKERGDRWVMEVQTFATYNKVELDPTDGEVRLGGGSAAPDTRFRRSATKRATFDDGAGGAATLDIIGTILNNGLALSAVPAGVVLPYGGDTAPAGGWLIADGAFVSQATYSALFTVYGHKFNGGTDPGNGTFKLPDLRQKFPMGKAASGTGATVGETGGSINHDHTSASHAHSHSHASAAHSHSHSHTSAAHSHSHAHTSASHSHSHNHQTSYDSSGTATGWRQRPWSYGSSTTMNRYVGTTAGSSTMYYEMTDSDATATTPGSTGTDATSTTPGDTGTDATSTTPGNTGGDATYTTPGNTGTNNPPFQVFNYIVKT